MVTEDDYSCEGGVYAQQQQHYPHRFSNSRLLSNHVLLQFHCRWKTMGLIRQ